MNLVVDAMNADIAARKPRADVRRWRNRLVFGLERVLVIWIGALLVMDSALTVGMLFAFVAYKEQFAQRVSALIDKWAELQDAARLQGERLADIVLSEPETVHAAMPAPPERERRSAAAAHRAARPGFPLFRQRGRRAARREPGHRAGRVGGHRRPVGLRQDHALKLMLGILAPGRARCSSAAAAGTARRWRRWRSMVGTVMQDDPLFAGSIADNISFFDSRPDMELDRRVRTRGVGARRDRGDADGLPHLDRRHGRQRCRVDRSSASCWRVRCTSGRGCCFSTRRRARWMSNANALVNQAVRQLQLTRVIVAHRPETIASADRVVVLAAGAVSHDLRSVGGTTAVQKAH